MFVPESQLFPNVQVLFLNRGMARPHPCLLTVRYAPERHRCGYTLGDLGSEMMECQPRQSDIRAPLHGKENNTKPIVKRRSFIENGDAMGKHRSQCLRSHTRPVADILLCTRTRLTAN